MEIAFSGQAARQHPQAIHSVIPGEMGTRRGNPFRQAAGPVSLLIDLAGQINEQIPHRLHVSSSKESSPVVIWAGSL